MALHKEVAASSLWSCCYVSIQKIKFYLWKNVQHAPTSHVWKHARCEICQRLGRGRAYGCRPGKWIGLLSLITLLGKKRKLFQTIFFCPLYQCWKGWSNFNNNPISFCVLFNTKLQRGDIWIWRIWFMCLFCLCIFQWSVNMHFMFIFFHSENMMMGWGWWVETEFACCWLGCRLLSVTASHIFLFSMLVLQKSVFPGNFCLCL